MTVQLGLPWLWPMRGVLGAVTGVVVDVFVFGWVLSLIVAPGIGPMERRLVQLGIALPFVGCAILMSGLVWTWLEDLVLGLRVRADVVRVGQRGVSWQRVWRLRPPEYHEVLWHQILTAQAQDEFLTLYRTDGATLAVSNLGSPEARADLVELIRARLPIPADGTPAWPVLPQEWRWVFTTTPASTAGRETASVDVVHVRGISHRTFYLAGVLFGLGLSTSMAERLATYLGSAWYAVPILLVGLTITGAGTTQVLSRTVATWRARPGRLEIGRIDSRDGTWRRGAQVATEITLVHDPQNDTVAVTARLVSGRFTDDVIACTDQNQADELAGRLAQMTGVRYTSPRGSATDSPSLPPAPCDP